MNWTMWQKHNLMDEAGDGNGGGDGGDGGALNNNGGGEGNNGGGDGIEVLDYEKMTDDDYVGKLQFDNDDAKAYFKTNFAAFCRENKIAPEVIGKYQQIEKKLAEDNAKEEAAAFEAEKKEFQEEGKRLHAEFNGEQIKSAVEALQTFSEDEKFMKFATSKLSNNPSLVKLLCCWADAHKEDNINKAGGVNGSSEKSFAKRWIG